MRSWTSPWAGRAAFRSKLKELGYELGDNALEDAFTRFKALADRTAQKVARGSAGITLQPMTAPERKIIHMHLKDHPRVQTASEGQEPYRAVVVSPRRSQS